MINKETRNTIKGYLEGFIQGMIEEATDNGFDPKQLRPIREASKKGDLKPFHESLLPDGLLKITEFERSFSTKLGTTFEECARLIAKTVHKNAERGHRVRGVVTAKAIKRIEEITSKIGSGGMKSKYSDFVKEIIELSKNGSGIERVSIADLYIETKSGEEWVFEIKTQKQNKGQCVEPPGRFHKLSFVGLWTFNFKKPFFAR